MRIDADPDPNRGSTKIWIQIRIIWLIITIAKIYKIFCKYQIIFHHLKQLENRCSSHAESEEKCQPE
jgi:hypothetical protein